MIYRFFASCSTNLCKHTLHGPPVNEGVAYISIFPGGMRSHTRQNSFI
jgi:hypothetical protein